MKMSRKERNDLAVAIQKENELVRKLGKWVRNSFIAALVFGALTYWGWSGMIDPMFPNIPDTARNVVKWVALILFILCTIFCVMCFLSHRNGKKSVLKKIEMFEK